MRAAMRSACMAWLLGAVMGPAWGENQGVAADRPNILWITCEDISPDLGCYGVDQARTPNLDRFATQSVRYTHAFAPIGVCAPSRSTIITGMWPPSIGTQHMRCLGVLPEGVRCFPAYLRDAGYYCSNNVKTDYNLRHPDDTWDESSPRAHWRNRKAGQPFFAIFNFTTTHESQIRQPEESYKQRVAELAPSEIHDPARVPLPPYHPDTPAVRIDWARYHDMITLMDRQVGKVLKELEDDGLADETIVFFYSDHGAGMPRGKRWLYDSSVRVPMMIRFPEKHRGLAPAEPGTTTDRLVSFVDLGPTVLSLAGVGLPGHFQGVPFLGKSAGEPRRYVHGFRDRMDERYDLIRMARDHRFKYIRNYRPELPYFGTQVISYMYEMPTMKDWQRLADEGRLQGPPALWMQSRKPVEELYDTEADPWEVRNLAGDPAYRRELDRLRGELDRWIREIVDLGFLNEADLRSRFGNRSPYDAVREDSSRYPIEELAAIAGKAAGHLPLTESDLDVALGAVDPSVRFWGIVAAGAQDQLSGSTRAALNRLAEDEKPWVRVAAAEVLARLGEPEKAIPVLIDGLASESEWVRLQAADALDRLGVGGEGPARAALERLLGDESEYVRRVAEHATGLRAKPRR